MSDEDRPPEGAVWVEHLDPEHCWALLGTVTVGRLGVLVDSAPEIYPVNFAVDDRSVVFRTDEGTKQRGLDRNPSVCFQADEIDEPHRRGWSVLVKGRAVEIGPDEGASDPVRDPARWGLGEGRHRIRIVPAEITGRRLDRAPDR